MGASVAVAVVVSDTVDSSVSVLEVVTLTDDDPVETVPGMFSLVTLLAVLLWNTVAVLLGCTSVPCADTDDVIMTSLFISALDEVGRSDVRLEVGITLARVVSLLLAKTVVL